MAAAIAWARRWLGIDDGAVALAIRSLPTPKPIELEQDQPDRWRRPWEGGRPIAATLAETYLAARRLRFSDPDGRVLRFAPRRARKSPVDDQLEYHPALLAALSDVCAGKQCGLINIYLKAEGSDRIRDKKGKTVTGRTKGAAVMLSDFDEPTAGLILCEGVETGIRLFQSEMRPIWACGGAGTLATLPVLGGIEALTITAGRSTMKPGMRNAAPLSLLLPAAVPKRYALMTGKSPYFPVEATNRRHCLPMPSRRCARRRNGEASSGTTPSAIRRHCAAERRG
jgi:hypothetical protein